MVPNRLLTEDGVQSRCTAREAFRPITTKNYITHELNGSLMAKSMGFLISPAFLENNIGGLWSYSLFLPVNKWFKSYCSSFTFTYCISVTLRSCEHWVAYLSTLHYITHEEEMWVYTWFSSTNQNSWKEYLPKFENTLYLRGSKEVKPWLKLKLYFVLNVHKYNGSF